MPDESVSPIEIAANQFEEVPSTVRSDEQQLGRISIVIEHTLGKCKVERMGDLFARAVVYES